MAIEVAATGTPDVRICPGCHGEIAPGLLSCPSCRRLVHAERLKELADAAEDAEAAGDVQAALAAWREAAGLLPQESRQYAAIAARIEKLGRRAEASPVEAAARLRAQLPGESGATGPSLRRTGGVATGVIGTLALALWKFKFLAVLFLTKAKFLLLGLTKASTFLTMFAALGVYWTAFGFWFALGLVRLHLHSRDGARGRADAIRCQGDRALVHPRARRGRPLEARLDRPEARRSRRAGWTDLGPRGGACLSCSSMA